MNEKTAIEVLEGAKKAINKYGWTQGKFVDHNTGCICLGEAIYIGADQETVVREGRYWRTKEKSYGSALRNCIPAAAARMAIRQVRTNDDGGIATFNDMLGQTKENILATIDKAIAFLKGEVK